MNWPALLSIAGAALTCYSAGAIAGFCVGRYGWRRPVPLPTVFRRRPADIFRVHGLEQSHRPSIGATIH